MESIFERDLIVTPDYCDASGALSPLAAFTIFQGIAAQHAETLGVGSAAMAKKGEFWLTVHTRVDLFCARIPDGRAKRAHLGRILQRARCAHVSQLHALAR